MGFSRNVRTIPLTSFSANASSAAPYVKAAARDVKAYRDSKKYRKVPVGYSAGEGFLMLDGRQSHSSRHS